MAGFWLMTTSGSDDPTVVQVGDVSPQTILLEGLYTRYILGVPTVASSVFQYVLDCLLLWVGLGRQLSKLEDEWDVF